MFCYSLCYIFNPDLFPSSRLWRYRCQRRRTAGKDYEENPVILDKTLGMDKLAVVTGKLAAVPNKKSSRGSVQVNFISPVDYSVGATGK